MLGHLDLLVASIHGRQDWTVMAAVVGDVGLGIFAWKITRVWKHNGR